MSKTRRITAASVCAVGAVAGAIAMAGPAFAAGTGTAVYNCTDSVGGSYPGVTVKYVRNSASVLTLTAAISSPAPIGVGDITGNVSWATNPPAPIGGLVNTTTTNPIVLSAPTSTALPTAPANVDLSIHSGGSGGPVIATVHCGWSSTTSWPVGGI
ncbi:hypothetical protein ACPA54_23895 [Uniformispora flossi]|uniref:hypothetical protein n=1 Tax=Uniformispora flossi TaxID=3390723 RepID=UPI003C3081D7